MGSQLEDQAAEARDEAAERTEALDEHENQLSGAAEDFRAMLVTADKRIAQLSGRVEELETGLRLSESRFTAFDVARDKWEHEAHDRGSKLNVAILRNLALSKQLDAATDLVSKVEDERDALRVNIARENADVTKEVCRAERAEREANRLREAIKVAKERTQNMVLYCGSTLERLRAPDTEIERETHGTDTGM